MHNIGNYFAGIVNCLSHTANTSFARVISVPFMRRYAISALSHTSTRAGNHERADAAANKNAQQICHKL